MNSLTILLIAVSVFLFISALGVPIIMSVLDPKRIPDNLVRYYRSKKTKVTVICVIIMTIVIGIIWLYAYMNGMLL